MGLTTVQQDKLREAEGLAGYHPGPERSAMTIESRLVDVVQGLGRKLHQSELKVQSLEKFLALDTSHD